MNLKNSIQQKYQDELAKYDFKAFSESLQYLDEEARKTALNAELAVVDSIVQEDFDIAKDLPVVFTFGDESDLKNLLQRSGLGEDGAAQVLAAVEMHRKLSELIALEEIRRNLKQPLG